MISGKRIFWEVDSQNEKCIYSNRRRGLQSSSVTARPPSTTGASRGTSSLPEKQCQPHPEGLFGGVLLLHLLSHHHPQIRLAYLDAETLPGLEKAERDVKDYAHKFVSFLLNIYYKFTKSAKKYSWLIFQKTLKN